jgi:type III secretory pathway component EscR
MQARNKEWAQQNKEKMREYAKAYKAQNKELIAERTKVYLQQNSEKRKATMQSYRQKNKNVEAENVRRRQAKLLQRTPEWLTVDDIWMMREAYSLAQLRTKMFGFVWHVDHVLPLRGKTVSGLHVPQNLQVISWADNLSKANRVAVS